MIRDKYVIEIDEVSHTASKKRASLNKYIIGVDEVGRGPLAGKVFVGAVLLSVKQNNYLKKYIGVKGKNIFSYKLQATGYEIPSKLNDSKKLSIKQRQEWFDWIKKNKIPFSISSVSSSVIDKINISQACNKAADKAIKKLMIKRRIGKVSVIADAGIKINKFSGMKSFRSFPKADELVPAVSLASIVAKISRDLYMVKLHDKYPQYGFDSHKGYGTKKHIQAIRKHGPSPIHRRSFIKKIV
jgi:ribonuclease HII